jgi:hypothetical protein
VVRKEGKERLEGRQGNAREGKRRQGRLGKARKGKGERKGGEGRRGGEGKGEEGEWRGEERGGERVKKGHQKFAHSSAYPVFQRSRSLKEFRELEEGLSVFRFLPNQEV